MLQPGPRFGGSVCIDVAWNNAIEGYPRIRKLYGQRRTRPGTLDLELTTAALSCAPV